MSIEASAKTGRNARVNRLLGTQKKGEKFKMWIFLSLQIFEKNS